MPVQTFTWNGSQPSPSTAIVPSSANAIAGSLSPVLFEGVPDPGNAGPMVSPVPVGSHVPKSGVLLKDGVDAPASEAVKANAAATTPERRMRACTALKGRAIAPYRPKFWCSALRVEYCRSAAHPGLDGV